MSEMQPEEIVRQIEKLSSKARTARDEEERRQYLAEALGIACEYTSYLWRKTIQAFNQFTDEYTEFGKDSRVSVRDLANDFEEFEPFLTPTEFENFLGGTRSLLIAQGRLNKKAIDDVIKLINGSYANIAESKLSKEFIDNEIFAKLDRFFCRGPDDFGGPGGGGGAPDDPDDGSGSGGVAMKVLEVTYKLSTIGLAVYTVASKAFPNTFPPIDNAKADDSIAMRAFPLILMRTIAASIDDPNGAGSLLPTEESPDPLAST